MVPCDGSQLCFQEVDSFLEMNVNVVQVIIKESANDPSCHQGEHEWKNKLLVTSTLKQDYCQGDCHSCHSSKYCGSTDQ